MKTLLLTLLIAFVVSACTKSLGTWTKQGMAESQHAKDHYACLQDAKYASTRGIDGIVNTKLRIDRDMYAMCMMAMGYQKVG